MDNKRSALENGHVTSPGMSPGMSTAQAAALIDVRGFLNRLGVRIEGPPSVGQLGVLHRAFVERVPYETLHIHLGRHWGAGVSTDPVAAVSRIVGERRGGYCYHLNGAFALLLRALGYRVRRQVAAVRHHSGDGLGPWGDHLALTVHDVPGSQDGDWFVDVGLGDALHSPLPLRSGVHRDAPWTFGLQRLDHQDSAGGGDWRFSHHAGGSFEAIEWRPYGVGDDAVLEDRHRYQSSSAESGFVSTFTAQRRYASGASILRGCAMTYRRGQEAETSVIESRADWFALLADEFGLTLEVVPETARQALWADVHSGHEAWVASGHR